MDTPAKSLENAIVAPNLERARRTALVAHNIVVKLKEMGLPDELNNDLASLSTDLADLWGAQASLNENLERFVESPAGDWKSVGDCLVDLKTVISHINSHGKNIRKPMNKITRFAYKEALIQEARFDELAK